MKVLAAMSGGVDSSVAAARMVDAGHEVVGVHMALSTAPGTLRTGSRGCCSKEDAADARRVADVLGIPFYVWDFAEKFKEDVINDFVSSYARGNSEPLRAVQSADQVRCSVRQGCGVGFRYGGHRPLRRLSGGRLRRAVDRDKDQSYVLAVLTAQQLRHAAFPIGDTPKRQIRAEAARRGLAVANKPDSHDICFIPSGNTKAFWVSASGFAVVWWLTRMVWCWLPMMGCTGSPSGSVEAWASPGRARMVVRAMSRRSTPTPPPFT